MVVATTPTPTRVQAGIGRALIGWAVVGAICTFVAAWVYLHWLLGGDAVRVGPGPDAVSKGTDRAALAFQLAVPSIALVTIIVLVRRCRSRRRLTLDAMVAIRTELVAYPSAIAELTLWAGKTYQVPLYAQAFWSLTLTATAALRFFVGDRDDAADRDRAPNRRATTVRLLAVIGFVHVAALAYDGAMNATVPFAGRRRRTPRTSRVDTLVKIESHRDPHVRGAAE